MFIENNFCTLSIKSFLKYPALSESSRSSSLPRRSGLFSTFRIHLQDVAVGSLPTISANLDAPRHQHPPCMTGFQVRSFPPPPFGSVYRYFWLLIWVLPPMGFFWPLAYWPNDINRSSAIAWDTHPTMQFQRHLPIWLDDATSRHASDWGLKIWRQPGWLKIRWLQRVVGQWHIWILILLENFHYQNEQATLNFKQRNVKVHK